MCRGRSGLPPWYDPRLKTGEGGDVRPSGGEGSDSSAGTAATPPRARRPRFEADSPGFQTGPGGTPPGGGVRAAFAPVNLPGAGASPPVSPTRGPAAVSPEAEARGGGCLHPA